MLRLLSPSFNVVYGIRSGMMTHFEQKEQRRGILSSRLKYFVTIASCNVVHVCFIVQPHASCDVRNVLNRSRARR